MTIFSSIRHGRLLLLTLLLLLASDLVAEAAGGLPISNRFSPLNRYRSNRPSTDFIILHTTEGGDRGSLDRIRRRGLAHYVVLRDGRVHRVIRRNKIALHAGRSMWDGVRNLDRRSIGIEVVGYHNKPITDRQVASLKELLRQLKKIYGLPDDRVLTHSMVAYGRPNRWHRHNHRGRKRCGMQFADPALRRRLGLESRPLFDPDVRAGRLVEADEYLARMLYRPEARPAVAARRDQAAPGDEAGIITARRSAWYIAREAYDDPGTVYVFPSGTRKRGDQIRGLGPPARGHAGVAGPDHGPRARIPRAHPPDPGAQPGRQRAGGQGPRRLLHRVRAAGGAGQAGGHHGRGRLPALAARHAHLRGLRVRRQGEPRHHRL